jgi:hypothetical protein
MNTKQIEQKIQSIYERDLLTRTISIKKEELTNETRVYKQALRHNIWQKKSDLIDDKFPNESDVINQYRNKNKRQFTKEVPRKIMQGIISVLTHIQIKVVSNNEKFNTWLSKKPFFFKDSFYDFNTWVLNCVIPYCLIDPNSIIVPLPKFINKLTPVDVIPVIVPHNKRWIDPMGEYLIIVRDDNRGFLYADKFQWWNIDLTASGYEWTLIYEHKLNELPYETMPGLSSFDEATKKAYNESIISSTYEILDEVVTAHTTAQAMRLKMNSIMIRPGVNCKTCSGEGKVKVEGQTRHIDCKECSGSGVAKRVSEHEDLVIKSSSILNEDQKIIKPEYINPDTSVAEFCEKLWRDFIIDAKKSVGIDALIDKQESGHAMRIRLGTFEEFISYLIYLVYKTTLTKYLEMVHKLVDYDPANWEDFPQIQTPKRIEIKTPEILKENFDNSSGAERVQAAIEYYNSLYAENPVMLRSMRIIIDHYPASIEKNEDLQTLKLLGVYTTSDLAKAKRVLPIVKKIIQELGTSEKTDEQIVQEAEQILKNIIPQQTISVIEE